MQKKFSIIIPTFRREDMVKRLLKSLSNTKIPPELTGIFIVENGDSHVAQAIVESYADEIPVSYLYCPEPGVSGARNMGIKASSADSDYYIFFDNDIRVGPETLTAYNNHFQSSNEDLLVGGCLLADYDNYIPPDWLLEYLPFSARGFDLGETQQITEPILLGGNFAVSSAQIEKVGLFDSKCATGEEGGALGEETRLQQRIINAGYKAFYLQDAVVWHYVPKNRCSPKWMLNRGYRQGITEAWQASQNKVHGKKLFGVSCWIITKYLIAAVQHIALYIFSGTESRFKHAYAYQHAKGMLTYSIKNK